MRPVHPSMNQWFAEKGITGACMQKFISDILPLLRISPVPDPEYLNVCLGRSGWKNLDLDASTVALIANGFEQAGLLGTPSSEPVDDPKGLNRLLEKIYQDRGVDFRGYARTSLARRINRRMTVKQVDSYSAYTGLLDRQPDEYGPLFDDLTVTVTRFFRNKAAFTALEKEVRTLMASRKERMIRVWSVGCATGQEPYSIAMCMDRLFSGFPDWEFRVLATDIDTRALEIAEKGLYDPGELEGMAPDRQAAYFSGDGDQLKIDERIRSRVVFQPHNIVSDPLFEQQDIIVCRNVLIYFNLSLQMRVTRLFYNALKSRGYVLLGRYEMLLKEARRQFSCIDFDARLYRKKQ